MAQPLPRPRKVIYDNGTEFESEWEEMLESLVTKGKPTTIKNLQLNAFVQRTHLVIAECIRSMRLRGRSYDETAMHAVLQAVAWSLRSTHHTSIQASPSQLAFGRDMLINATYIANWRNIRQRQRQNALINNARETRLRIPHNYQPGQKMYVVNRDTKRKLSPDKEGPFVIVRAHINGT